MMYLPNITRVEIIDSNGRSYVQWNAKDVQIALQDNNKTLKVFLENESRGSVLSEQPTGN